jgi:phenylacetate-CoA ligase
LEKGLGHVAAYREWRRWDPGQKVDPLERLAAMPRLRKADMRRLTHESFVSPGLDLAGALARGEVELVHTSGSTGDRVTNVWSQEWWDRSERESWKLNRHALSSTGGQPREAILTSALCTGFPCEDGYLTRPQRTLGRFLYLNERSDPTSWTRNHMDRMVRELNAFRPDVLEANPSFLARLSRHITGQGRKVRSPGVIILTYENPSLLHYRQIRAAFDCPVASSYGSTEAGYVFMECEAGRLHQNTRTCHVDFIPFRPEHGGPRVGRILVTNFDNPWRVLLRFDIGDIVRLDGSSPCPCGRTEGLVALAIEGRAGNLVQTPEGRAVTQRQVDEVVAELRGVAEYQFLQVRNTYYELRLVKESGAGNPRLEGEARARLGVVFGPAAKIRINFVPAIQPDPPGKYRLTKATFRIDPDGFLDPRHLPGSLP